MGCKDQNVKELFKLIKSFRKGKNKALEPYMEQVEECSSDENEDLDMKQDEVDESPSESDFEPSCDPKGARRMATQAFELDNETKKPIPSSSSGRGPAQKDYDLLVTEIAELQSELQLLLCINIFMGIFTCDFWIQSCIF